jgi:hypothetical protein
MSAARVLPRVKIFDHLGNAVQHLDCTKDIFSVSIHISQRSAERLHRSADAARRQRQLS